ncbi:MAG TPA: substrate-binding domain-containing protein [Chthonomonadales bacterium]|nr:substrate-binding domain-containing protein [Chthonomonadales bacterium]
MTSRPLKLLAALALLSAAGCGRETVEAPPRLDGALGQAQAPVAASRYDLKALDGLTRASRAYRIALVVKTRNNPFFDPMIKAAEREAATLGVRLEVHAPPQEVDKEQQFSMVQNIAATGIDAILIAPADSKGIVPALKQAEDQGVLVVNVDNRVDPATATAAGLKLGGYVGADNEEGGAIAGRAMVAALGAAPGAPRPQVAVLEGIRGTDNAEARKRGFVNAAKDLLDIRATDTAEWDTQKAYAKFQSMLAANPGLTGLFCANDKMALGAMKAIKEAGKTGTIRVIGYDNIPDVQPALRSGEMYATIEQHPGLMGRYGLRLAVGLLDRKLERGGELLVPLELVKGR